MADRVYTVGQVSKFLSDMISSEYSLRRIYVRGEVSNCKYHSLGHIYFTLKDEKASIQSAVDNLKEVNKGTDIQAIKDATEAVQKAFYAVSEKLYQQANPQGGAQGGYQQPDDGVVDADYETVD